MEEVSRLRSQLLVQQQWLPTIAAFKLFQTASFKEFLIRCRESFRAGVITTTFEEVMSSHPEVDLRNHEGYDPKVVETADDNLMKAVLSPLSFPFLEDLRSSDRLRTFEEIILSTVDEDEAYRRRTE